MSGAYVYSLNGKTSEAGGEGGDEPGGDTTHAGTLADPYTVADAAAAVANLTWTSNSDYQKVGPYYVKGKIASIKYTYSAQYGTATFNISDDGGTSSTQFTCYSVKYFGGESWVEGNTQVAVGDEVIIYGELQNYKGNTPETVSGAYVYSLNGKTSEDGGEGGDEPGGDEPGGGDNPGTGSGFTSNVSWTTGTNSYEETALINNESNVKVLKLGTSKATGSSTLTLPAGSTSLTFYAISWSGKQSKVVFKVSGEEVASKEPAANSGASGNQPYTITVSDSDKYTINFSATSTITVETSGSNTRVILFGVNAQ